MNTDRIVISELEINTIIGVYDWERAQPQRILVDLILDTDFSAAAASDDVADTIDYAQVASELDAIAQSAQPKLLEYLANLFCQHLFEHHPINKAELTINKPDILDSAKSVGIRVIRSRDKD